MRGSRLEPFQAKQRARRCIHVGFRAMNIYRPIPKEQPPLLDLDLQFADDGVAHARVWLLARHSSTLDPGAA